MSAAHADPAAGGPGPDGMALLQRAMQAHQGGRLADADALYILAAKALEGAPQHADALHMRGVLHAQRRDWEQAQALIWEAITLNPNEAMFHNNLGNVCLERGMMREAEAMYVRAIELDGSRLDALSNLGLLLGRTDREPDAEKLLLRAVELSPGNADFRQNLANLYMRTGRYNEAVHQCHDGLLRTPRSRFLRELLVLGYCQVNRRQEAREVLDGWIADDPEDPYPRHHLAALTGQDVPARAGNDYVQRVFDSFSSSFDAKLTDLSYQAPQHVADALARLAGPAAPLAEVLDAGCGTGLCGPLLAPYAQHLTGVDLSEGMLRNALAVGAYDALLMGDLVAFLEMRPGGFDLIASADTLCYFGALEAFAAAAAGALSAGSLLIFTVEAHEDAEPMPPFRLQPNGRYSHRSTYVERVLNGAGLSIVENLPVVLRTEASAPVQGRLVTARAVLSC